MSNNISCIQFNNGPLNLLNDARVWQWEQMKTIRSLTIDGVTYNVESGKETELIDNECSEHVSAIFSTNKTNFSFCVA